MFTSAAFTFLHLFIVRNIPVKNHHSVISRSITGMVLKWSICECLYHHSIYVDVKRLIKNTTMPDRFR